MLKKSSQVLKKERVRFDGIPDHEEETTLFI
jgi:hypothetical protein